MFWKEFNRFEKGILAFVYDTSDRVQHMYWEDKQIVGEEPGIQISKEIEEYYVKKDAFIGEVLSKIDSDTALMIVSDHGFTSFERCFNANSWLVENGYMTLKSKPTSEDTGELFSLVDWEKTKAYSVGFGGIYII